MYVHQSEGKFILRFSWLKELWSTQKMQEIILDSFNFASNHFKFSISVLVQSAKQKNYNNPKIRAVIAEM